MTTIYNKPGLSAELEENEAVSIYLEGKMIVTMTVDELLAIADAVRAKMEEV